MDSWNVDDPPGYGWNVEGRGEWSSDLWNVFGRNGPSTLERDSTECDARRLICGWADTGRKLEVLEPRGWATSAHQLGSFGWFSAPAAADAAIDQFCDALHKRPSCFHVFAIPLLMTNRSKKQLLKATDVYFVLKADSMIWNNLQHEPLGIFISLTLSRHGPCHLRQTKTVVDTESAMRELPPDDFLQKGNVLRKFLGLKRQLETMPEGLVRELLHTPGRKSLPGLTPKR
jgi:hypothetical protein